MNSESSVKKALPKAVKYALNDYKTLEKEIVKLYDAYCKKLGKTDLTQKELIDFVNKSIPSLKQNIKDQLRTSIRRKYYSSVDEVAKELGINILPTSSDERIIDSVLGSETFAMSLTVFDTNISKIVQDSLISAFEGKSSISKITKELSTRLAGETYQLERIARTESQNIQTLAREESYKRELAPDEQKFKWIGPNDRRTTPICQKIKSRTSQGVSLEELKKIIREEADQKIYNPQRPYTPHIQCRHIQVRVVG